MKQLQDVNDVADRLLGLGNLAIYFLTALGVIFIVYNVVWYLIRPGAEDKNKTGFNIFWGIVGLFIIVSLWGLVNILVNTFSTNPTTPGIDLPRANVGGDLPSYPVSNKDNQFMTPGSAANDPDADVMYPAPAFQNNPNYGGVVNMEDETLTPGSAASQGMIR